MASAQDTRRVAGVASTEVDAYVKNLQAGHDGSSTAPVLTVENVLARIYERFYNKAGQSPFPDGLPFSLKTLPTLAAIASKQARITAYVQCAVATRPIVTVHELEVEICAAENVMHFSEVGLGSSLVALPVVQQLFRLNAVRTVAPVTSTMFLEFLLYSPVARTLLDGGGDSADTIRAFAQRHANGKYSSAQLGIHIQHFSWLNLIVRQEIGKFSTMFRSMVRDTVRRREQNALIYERAIEGIDAALASADISERSAVRPGHSLNFTIRATAAEAETTSLPPACWGTADGPSGGLCLYGVLQADSVFGGKNENTAPLKVSVLRKGNQSWENTQEDDAHSRGTEAKGTSFSLSTLPLETKAPSHGQTQPPLPVTLTSSHSRKRRRGELVVDTPTAVIMPIESEVHPVSLTTQEPSQFSHRKDVSPTVSLSFPELLPLMHCAAALHPLSRPKMTSIGHYTSLFEQCGSKDFFHISAETLARLVITSDAPQQVCDLYAALAGKATTKALGTSVLECFESNMSELILLPLANSPSFLPIAAVRGSLSGSVLMSGHWKESDLSNPWIFHPLQFIFDGEGDRNFCNLTLAIIDGKRLFDGLSDCDSHRLLLALADHGVLLEVPESWLAVDGIIARFIRKCFQTHVENGKLLARRALLLFWWFVFLLADKSCHSQSTANLEATFFSLSDTRWIPHTVAASDISTMSNVCIASWKKPSELFLYTDSFIQSGLKSLLCFAPYNIDHLRFLLPQPCLSTSDQELCACVETWMRSVPTRQCFQEMSLQLSMKLNVLSTLTAPVALNILRSMELGQCVGLSTLRHLFHILKSGTDDELGEVREAFFIPLPENTNSVLSEDGSSFVIMEIGDCASVCWASPDVDDIPFSRSLAFLGDSLRSFFVTILGVSPVSTVASWIAVARTCRRKTGIPSLSLTNSLLRLLSESCKSQYAHLHGLHEMKCAANGTSSERALEELVSLVPQHKTMTEYLFPFKERWHRPAEGIFFCGPYYDSVASFPFNCEDSAAPSLPVLMFGESLHFSTVAVLQHMGLMAVEECTERTTTFNQVNVTQTADLHAKIADCVPQVQSFLMAHHPRYYNLVREQVHSRLEHFSLALTASPVLCEVLRYQKHAYTMRRELRYLYVAQHNCLYGVDEPFTPAVGASAIADIFLPFPDPEVRESLSSFLERFFCDPPDASAGNGLRRLTGSEERLWVLSTAPDKRFRDHFPPGTDAFHSSFSSPVGQRMPKGSAVSLWSAEGGMVRTPPQWNTEFFDSPCAAMRTASHDKQPQDDDGVDSSGDETDVRNRTAEGYLTNRLKTRRSKVRPQRNVVSLSIDNGHESSQEYAVAAERFAYEEIRAEAPQNVEVVWVNEHGESGQPFDIVMVRKHANGDRKDVVMYIEVKSTCTSNRRDFEMSLREFVYAARFGRAYSVCRVFGASTNKLKRMRMEKMDNILNLWRNGKVTLTGQVKVMMT